MVRYFKLVPILALAVLSACKEEEQDKSAIVRGVKTFVVTETQSTTERHYPGVLEPATITTLSFEIGGTLKEMGLAIGQTVSSGDTLVELDPTLLRIQLENAQAAVEQALARFTNAERTLNRQRSLLDRGAATQVSVDNAETDFLASKAGLDQAKKVVEAAQEDLTKTALHAPFTGIINSVDADSFATVSAGTHIASLYANDSFEVSFSINFEAASQIEIGTPAKVQLVDRPRIKLDAIVTEVGSRADIVSAYPVVVSVTENNPLLKAGMAVETTLEFPLPEAVGYLVPLSAVSTDLTQLDRDLSDKTDTLVAFVYDKDSSTVQQREIEVAGIRENSLIVISGLQPGDRVASAGVSFLRDGQSVNLLKSED